MTLIELEKQDLATPIVVHFNSNIHTVAVYCGKQGEYYRFKDKHGDFALSEDYMKRHPEIILTRDLESEEDLDNLIAVTRIILERK